MNKLNTSYNSLGLPPKDSKPNINQRTAEIYNYVAKIVQEAKANGDLAPGENLNIEGIVGQILQESGNGMSDLTLKGNNFGGIKADNNWGGEVIKMGGATYRKFATPEEGLKNQVYFYIDNPRYRKNGVMQATTPEEHLKAVQKAGYAGDPNYVANTMKMVNSIQPRLKKAGVAPMPTTTTDAPVVTTEQLQPQVEADLTPTKLKTIPVTALTGNMQMPTGPVEMNSQYGSQAYVQKVPQAQEQDIEIPTGWFGSGKSLFNYGGNLNSMNMRSYNRYAGGGPMEQLTQFNAGGLHEENPLGGIPQGMSPDGQMNLVEQGETKLNSANYVFSDKLKVDKAIAEEFNLPKSTIGKTFSEASKKADRPHSRREGDDIETKAKQRDLDSLMQAQEAYKQKDAEQKIAELQALHPEAFASLVGQQGGMPQDPMAMGQEQMPPMSEEEAMMMQQQMAMQGVPQSYGGQMYAFGGNMKNPEAAQKWAKGLGMAAPFLNLIPGVGQVASLAAGAASAGLGMAANNAMTAQSEQQAMMEANRMGNDYGGAIPPMNQPMNPALGYANGGYMNNQYPDGGYFSVTPFSQNMHVGASRNIEGNDYKFTMDPYAKVGIEKFNVLPKLGKKFVPLYAKANVNVPYRDPSKAGVYGSMGFSGERTSEHGFPMFGFGELHGGYSKYNGAHGGMKAGADIFLSRGPMTPNTYENDKFQRNTLVGKISPHLRAGFASGVPGDDYSKASGSLAYGVDGELKYRFGKKFPGVAFAKGFLDFDPLLGSAKAAAGTDTASSGTDTTFGMAPIAGFEAGMRFPINPYKLPSKEAAKAKAKADKEAEAAREKRSLEIARYQREMEEAGAGGTRGKSAKEVNNPTGNPSLYWESLNGEAQGPAQEEFRNIKAFSPTMNYAYGGYMGRQFAPGGPLGPGLQGFDADSNGDSIPDYLGASTTDMNMPVNTPASRYDTGLDNNYKDLTVNETAGEFIGKYAPAAVNLARGMFEKVETARPEDFYTKIDPYRMDFNPARRDAEQGFASLQNSMAGAGPGAGSYMTNMQNAMMMRNKAMQDINATEENAYQQSKFTADATNAAALTQAKKDAYGINLANKAAKNAIFNQGLTDVSDIAKANQQNKLATSYYSMMAPDFAGSVGFNPYFSKKRGQ